MNSPTPAGTASGLSGSRAGSTLAESEIRGQGIETEAATGVTAYLLAGPLTFGGIGYGLDRWLGTTWIVAVGILSGVALAIYVIWLRYGDGTPAPTASGDPCPERHNADPASSEVVSAGITTNEESQ